MMRKEIARPRVLIKEDKMISLHPKNLREFNRQLFAGTAFDAFLVPEAHFHTAFRTDIDGQPSVPKESGEEAPASCIRWSTLRGLALAIVHGTEAPKSFSLVFKLPDEEIVRLLPELAADPAEVGGLYLNIRYAREELSITTGCRLKVFSLDKTWEKAWDLKAEEYLRQKGLV